MKQATELASVALRDVSVRRALFVNDIDRKVKPVCKKLTKRDQQNAGLCWLFAGLSYIEALYFQAEIEKSRNGG